MAGANEFIGVGVYSPVQAARLLHVPTQLLQRWIYGDRRHKPAVSPYFTGLQDPRQRVLTFFDLVQLLAIREARNAKLPLEAIREAVTEAQRQYGESMPLTFRHAMYIFDGSVWIHLHDKYPHVVGLSRKDRGQHASAKIVQSVSKGITFDLDGRAESWVPMRRGKNHILLHRKRRFGQPMVMPKGYVTSLIAPSVIGEGSVRAAAEAYGIPTAAMQLAWDFEKECGTADLST